MPAGAASSGRQQDCGDGVPQKAVHTGGLNLAQVLCQARGPRHIFTPPYALQARSDHT